MSSATTEGSARATPPAPIGKVAAASLAGATLEWYEFQLYGWLSALAFNRLFFPAGDPAVGTLVALVGFGVGFIARPIGALLFGHLGDRIGRKSTLLATLLLVGVPTVLTGLLPTYEQIGIWAPILLVGFRLLQGLGLGGEFGGAALIVVEHAPNGRRGFWGTAAAMGNPAGQLLSIAAVFLAVSTLSDEQFLAWGWRMPYLFGVVIVIAGFYLRLRVGETPAFRAMRESGRQARLPMRTLIRTYPGIIFKAFGARLADAGTWAVFLVFGITYVTNTLHLPKSWAIAGVAGALLGQLVVVPLAGALSDRIGRRPVIMAGSLVVAVAVFPSFALMNTGQPLLVCLAYFLGFPIGVGMIFAPTGALLPELFDANVRFSGTSVVFQLSSLAAGFVPATAAALLVAGGGTPWLVCGFLVLLCLVSWACAYALPETRGRDLTTANVDGRENR